MRTREPVFFASLGQMQLRRYCLRLSLRRFCLRSYLPRYLEPYSPARTVVAFSDQGDLGLDLQLATSDPCETPSIPVSC
jgi:hypothetical protein